MLMQAVDTYLAVRRAAGFALCDTTAHRSPPECQRIVQSADVWDRQRIVHIRIASSVTLDG